MWPGSLLVLWLLLIPACLALDYYKGEFQSLRSGVLLVVLLLTTSRLRVAPN